MYLLHTGFCVSKKNGLNKSIISQAIIFIIYLFYRNRNIHHKIDCITSRYLMAYLSLVKKTYDIYTISLNENVE